MPSRLDDHRKMWYVAFLKPTKHFQKLALNRMKKAERQFAEWAQLFAVAPCGLVLLDSHAVIKLFNPSAARLLGIEPERARGRPLIDVLPSWEETPLYAGRPSLLGAQWSPTGKPVAPDPAPVGRPSTVARDSGERVPRGGFASLGRSPEPVEGRAKRVEPRNPERPPRFRLASPNETKRAGGVEGSTVQSVDFEVPGPEQIRLRVCAVSVPNEAQEAPGVLLTITEGTEVATLERRLRRAEHQASIGRLARGIAHELNSPLDGVLRYTDLALGHLKEDSPVREYLMHVKEGLDRMVRSVRTFLEFSRQATTPVTRVANLNQLIDDTLLLVSHRAKAQRIRIVKRFDDVLPPVVDGGLQHAVVNLVKNAFDAMPRGGILTITTHHQDAEVVLDIADTGSGIPTEARGRIFEPFFSTKPIHQGNGLGLIIAKDVVERSGGTIAFRTQPEVGTTFSIHLPVAPAEGEKNGT